MVLASLVYGTPMLGARLAGAMDRRSTRDLPPRCSSEVGRARAARAIRTSDVVQWMRLALALAAPSAPEHHPQVPMATCS
jgi:hypothetical protein